MIVIEDEQYLARALGVTDAEVFVPSRRDAYSARADLERFVRDRMKVAKSSRESFRWRQLLLKRPVYIWHCGGYAREGSRFVYCTLSRYQPHLREPRFPEVYDGGTDYCRAHFSLRARRLVEVSCNADV